MPFELTPGPIVQTGTDTDASKFFELVKQANRPIKIDHALLRKIDDQLKSDRWATDPLRVGDRLRSLWNGMATIAQITAQLLERVGRSFLAGLEVD